MSMLAARTVPHEQPGGAPRPLLEWVRRIVPAWAHRPGYFLLPVLAVALLLVLRRIDAALHQMHLPGESGGGALSFPLWPPSATETVRAQHQVWRQYLAEVSATRVAAPQTLVRHLVLLDLLFIAVYGVLLVVLLSRLYAANRGLPDGFVPARGRMLITAGFGVVLLCAIDVAEDVLLWLAFGPAQAAAVATVGSVLTIAKFAILALIALPVLLTTIAFVIGCPPVGRVLVSARAVLAELGLVVAVLLVFGLGKNQTDDVVRAWQPLQGLSALLAGLMGALVVVGVTTHLTDSALDRPRPDDGKDPQWLVFGAGLALIAAGLLARTVGLGWGLAVPGGLLILLGLLGLPLVGLPARRPAPATAD